MTWQKVYIGSGGGLRGLLPTWEVLDDIQVKRATIYDDPELAEFIMWAGMHRKSVRCIIAPRDPDPEEVRNAV